MFKNILMPTDGSELSNRAARQAITIAGRGAVGSLLLGSETQKVLASTKLPIVVVH